MLTRCLPIAVRRLPWRSPLLTLRHSSITMHAASHEPLRPVRSSLPPSSFSPPSPPSPLVLHFDVNQTIILADSAQDVSAEAAISMIIADHAWGTATPHAWRLTHPTLSIDPPSSPSSSSLITYSDWLDRVHPTLCKLPTLSLQERSDRKAKRGVLRSRFTEAGQPGEALAPTLQRLSALTRIPAQLLRNDWPRQHYYILPAFYHFILWLQHTRRSFMLLFRTFGQDIPEVQAEWNLFCEGKHPAFPFVSLDGSGRRSETERYVTADGPLAEPDRSARPETHGQELGEADVRNLVDRRLLDANCGYGYRTGGTSAESHLLIGAVPHSALPKSLTLPLTGSEWSAFTAHSSFSAMAEFLNRVQPTQATLAVRDYHAYWEGQRRAAGTGKVILVDEKGGGQGGVKAMFFDDSLHDNIVDVRSLDGAEMTVEQAKQCGVIIHHARCLRILEQPDYFIAALRDAEKELQQTTAATPSAPAGG